MTHLEMGQRLGERAHSACQGCWKRSTAERLRLSNVNSLPSSFWPCYSTMNWNDVTRVA